MKKRLLYVLLSALLIIGIIVPVTVLADEPFSFDSSIMDKGSNGKGYTGSKDAAFEIVDDTLKIRFHYSTMMAFMGGTAEVTSVDNGFINNKAAEWISSEAISTGYPFTIALNGTELSTNVEDSTYGRIANVDLDPVTYDDIVEIAVKPGTAITSDFFDHNQIVIIKTTDKSSVSIGSYEQNTASVHFDSLVMASGSNGKGYSGSKDAAFEVVDNTLKIRFHYSTMMAFMGGTAEVTSVDNGYINNDAAAWISSEAITTGYPFTITLNGTVLSTNTEDSTYGRIANVDLDPVTYDDIVEIAVKPGKEITSDFFAENQLVIEKTTNSEKVVLGNYSGPTPQPEPDPEPTIKPAKKIDPVEDYRVPSESNQVNNLQLRINSDSDKDWAGKLTKVTYSFDGGEPVEMVLGKGSIISGGTGDVSYEYVDSGEVAVTNKYPDTIYIGIRYSFFQNQNIPKGESREYTFTFKADGYEDSVVKQTVRNPKEVLEVAVNKGAKYSFALEDLQKMWKDEGSKEYTYSVYDTIPDVLEQEKHYGPTLKTVLAASKIDLDSLADNDVIEFSTPSNISLGYKARITVKDLKEKRYAFPNGASPNKFKGTTAEQLEGKTEVPYIISLTGGENNLRNIFGQRDPQEEQKYDWVQYLGKITVYKGTATVYDGLTPSIESGSKVKEGDKLNFDFSTTGWQAGTASYAGIYYTVSTDGTEPADPTFSDIFYNYRQYGNPSYKDHPEYFNAYEFTNAEKTIIKAMIYIRGYEEPKVMTLTYTHDHAAAAAVKENEKAATCTEPGSYEEVVYCSECGAEISRETKTVEALGHTEVAIGEAKAATCTEAGMTAGKKCSVCGETLEAQKELPALGHDWKVIPEVISTCTKKGSTAGVRCTRCGEYMLEPHEVPMVYHDYQNGKCTVCGAEDPDYKPDEPTPVEPDTKFTGLANEADKDGVWWYYTDGKIDKTHTGVDQNKYGWWRVENGKVNFNAQSIYQNQYGWWKTTDGKVTFKENRIYKNEYGWWKCKDSKVDFKAQSIYQNQYGWWKTTDGKVTFKEQGIYQNEYGWWKCKDSKVDFNANGKVTYNGKTYNVKNGKATLS